MLKEATAKYYKQLSAESQLLEVCYYGGHPWLKGAQMVKQGGILVGQCGLRIRRFTERMGVPECGRVPRHWN